VKLPGFVTGSPGGTSRLVDPRLANVPKKPRRVDSRVIAQHLSRWKDQGFVPDKKGETEGGWPKSLLRVEDTKEGASDYVPFDLQAGGIHIPRGYVPSIEKAVDGYPRTLAHDGTILVRIPGGKFRLGGLKLTDLGLAAIGTQPGPQVELSGFYMQKTETTSGEFEPFYNSLGQDVCPEWKKEYEKLKLPSRLGREEAQQIPVFQIPWKIAAYYAHAKGGKLPTEAQWEYTARSRGLNKLYVWGNDTPPGELASLNGLRGIQQVAHYPSDVTEQGIFDMAGNVQEWCRDIYKPYEPGAPAQKDPQDPPSDAQSDSSLMVVRGGSFGTGLGDNVKTIAREGHLGNNVTRDLGFRIVIECPERIPEQ
jgi:serine/threonine-protein kinase